jgi:type I restriction enzyme S subunit
LLQSILDFDVTPMLVCVFNENSVQQQILNLAGGAAQPNISGSQIESITVQIPKLELELAAFCEKHLATFQLISNLKAQNTQLRQARDLLLPKLMSGEIDMEEVSGTTYNIDESFDGSIAAEDEVVYQQTNK